MFGDRYTERQPIMLEPRSSNGSSLVLFLFLILELLIVQFQKQLKISKTSFFFAEIR